MHRLDQGCMTFSILEVALQIFISLKVGKRQIKCFLFTSKLTYFNDQFSESQTFRFSSKFKLKWSFFFVQRRKPFFFRRLFSKCKTFRSRLILI